MNLGGFEKGFLGALSGFKVIKDPNLTVLSEPFAVARTWRERLFSRPWRPFQRTRMVQISIPSPHLTKIGDKLIGHPETIAKLLERMREAKEPK